MTLTELCSTRGPNEQHEESTAPPSGDLLVVVVEVSGVQRHVRGAEMVPKMRTAVQAVLDDCQQEDGPRQLREHEPPIHESERVGTRKQKHIGTENVVLKRATIFEVRNDEAPHAPSDRQPGTPKQIRETKHVQHVPHIVHPRIVDNGGAHPTAVAFEEIDEQS